jgi:hypothetical protein
MATGHVIEVRSLSAQAALEARRELQRANEEIWSLRAGHEWHWALAGGPA